MRSTTTRSATPDVPLDVGRGNPRTDEDERARLLAKHKDAWPDLDFSDDDRVFLARQAELREAALAELETVPEAKRGDVLAEAFLSVWNSPTAIVYGYGIAPERGPGPTTMPLAEFWARCRPLSAKPTPSRSTKRSRRRKRVPKRRARARSPDKPRRGCGCGCGQEIPAGKRGYVDDAHASRARQQRLRDSRKQAAAAAAPTDADLRRELDSDRRATARRRIQIEQAVRACCSREDLQALEERRLEIYRALPSANGAGQTLRVELRRLEREIAAGWEAVRLVDACRRLAEAAA